MDLPDVWIGFEAIVAAFDDEHVTCPFQTGSVPAVVTKDSPVLIAPSLDDTTDLASCLWNLIPDDNHVLKIFFPIIQLHNDFELFEVDIDNKEGYSASGPGNAVLPTGPYYANSSIRVKFVYKKDTGPGMHDINFFGVVSAFPKNEQAADVVDNLILIDGELNSVSSTTPVSSLSPKLMVNESPPFVSKTGTITIGRVGPKLSVLLYAPAQILIKVYDESRDLTDTQALIGSTPYTNINKIMCPSKLNLDYCVFLLGAANLRFPLTIGSYPEVRLFITDLDGTEQKVKVIAGLDTTRVPFFEFK
ncbi:hypothetical protein QR680_015857 [Steinernema hermaphroditum]|uniref:CUB domain-containing protein n=1 Tax=Steinernema hermaphroditum TaxID=289476 RepID=A0AA39H971_9BILA|nr:hypothetical protein QR680_015857 [Steinernema hermaphroditum]